MTSSKAEDLPAGSSVGTADAAGESKAARKRARSSKRRRRISGLLALGVALIGVGALYSAIAPEPQTANAAQDPALIRKGEQIYNNTCITCHGEGAEGVKDRGPSLIGIGEASVYFQTSTGRMPLAAQTAQAERKPPKLSPDEIDAVIAFIESKGAGGPKLPSETGAQLRGDNPARGGELFRMNCASCHNFTGRGGALSSGKFAPELDPATEEQLYAAMLSGPQNMPKFSDRQLSPEEKKDIIAYVKSVTDGNNNPGGAPLGGLGPQSEGLIAFIVGMAALVGITLWIGAKS
ncbi:ubiquinol-cytochrome c reductase cytochrome c subunit [Kibdelosporangium banguiense]|uniref:Cytochrome bc1 complex cytochrome c subunit n=1 Tax=Kibdelosporangium banguiense TaxID=1365924 RepID=A0ABS4U3A5_9PSEU|nr:c-type cytochrome [Kibdelosporangium banguiense]MBP2331147.1 ubiquinol-cytochrome c reductase cytochrome c subunit [Kibdelosporangium banguiense]